MTYKSLIMMLIVSISLLSCGKNKEGKTNESFYKKIEHWENGKVKSKSSYFILSSNLKHGLTRNYNPKGALTDQQYYLFGHLYSEKKYYEFCQPRSYLYNIIEDTIMDYIDSTQGLTYGVYVVSGNYIQYYRNGKVKESGYIKLGNKIGLWKFYSLKGNLIKEENW